MGGERITRSSISRLLSAGGISGAPWSTSVTPADPRHVMATPGSPVREALVELNQARTAAVRIGVACNKLAAKALAGGEVSAAELAAAASRSVAPELLTWRVRS